MHFACTLLYTSCPVLLACQESLESLPSRQCQIECCYSLFQLLDSKMFALVSDNLHYTIQGTGQRSTRQLKNNFSQLARCLFAKSDATHLGSFGQRTANWRFAASSLESMQGKRLLLHPIETYPKTAIHSYTKLGSGNAQGSGYVLASALPRVVRYILTWETVMAAVHQVNKERSELLRTISAVAAALNRARNCRHRCSILKLGYTTKAILMPKMQSNLIIAFEIESIRTDNKLSEH